ncbi:PREDICTED: protein ripply2 [Odobenus rosmarus divergens]|uniref:Protein ripply2 n=1 Tax=Odobenus rosmarus divergens TaxID=9708 RepID=A0A2U3WH22_ODORO|nr:PREDICTED: protein ripply2 [Odobenus rosmarus divergens]
MENGEQGSEISALGAGERGAERERTSQYAAGSRGSLYKARVSGLTEGRGPAGPRAGSRLLLGPAAPWKPGSPQRAEPATRRPAGFWRPWVDARGYKEEGAPQPPAEAMPDGPGVTEASGKLSQYRHPVRLFWPKSKCYDYLYQEAEALLKNFPIQATISFYEDSDSEDDIEELICEN